MRYQTVGKERKKELRFGLTETMNRIEAICNGRIDLGCQEHHKIAYQSILLAISKYEDELQADIMALLGE